MRPLELKLRNFRSYFGDEAAFDFRGRRLLGIVGPIGSGKSSLLDAVAFALYGRTPTVAANTRSLIHQRADECAVSLRFEVEGEVWEAVRMLRRKGASQHALYRYDGQSEDDAVEKVLLESEVNARVRELLGLEFDAFGRSVMLAQGRFAEFLRARPAERDKVLKGVFGHERIDLMRQAARRRASDAEVEADKLAARVEHTEKLASELEERRGLLVETSMRVDLLAAAGPRIEELQKNGAAAKTLAASAEQRAAELADIGRRLPAEDLAARTTTAAIEAADARSRAAAALEEARIARSAAETAAEALRASDEAQAVEEASGVLAALNALERVAASAAERQRRVADRLATQKAVAEQVGRDVDAAREEARRLAADAAAAADVRAAAADALHAAQHDEMAAELRDTLVAGERCPVCEQTVAGPPEALRAPALDEARRAHDQAVRAADRATSARDEAMRAEATAQAAHRAADEAVAALEMEHAEAADAAAGAASDVAAETERLRELLGEGDPASLIAARRAALDAAGHAVTSASETVDRARAAHDQAIRDEQEAEKALSALRVDLADLGARLDLPGETGASPAEVADQLGRLRTLWADAVESARVTGVDANRAAGEAEAAMHALLEELRVDGDFSAALGEARGRREVLETEIAKAEREISSAADLIAQREDHASRAADYARIAADLTDARFVRYLLDDERARLAALGGDHFLRLTSGRYLFDQSGRFDVIDQTAAGAVRKAESLSGGETFLASLALALALAEMVSRTGGRLDAFFLDEGFGALDPEHLDLAMDGVEALVAGAEGRLVVVVSHVPELKERIEDLIVLDRHPVTGDTRVVRS